LLAIDLGTSGVKVLVAAADDARPLAEAAAGYPVDRVRAGWAESDPDAWWAATVSAVRSALADAGPVRVLGIGIDGQMHGLVLSDAAGRPVRPAMLWADRRAVALLHRWRALPERMLRELANPVTPGMTGPLWAWVARHEPQILARARWALLPKDWVRLRLTGTAASEPSDASATLLWNVPEDRWHVEVGEAVGLDPALLPPVLPSGGRAGELTAAAAAEIGLAPGIPVAAGAADTAAGLLGTGLTDPAAVQITVGSGAQIVRPSQRPTASPSPVVHTYRTAADTGWYAMAAVQNAGLALDWVRGVFAATWAELYGSGRAHPPGAGGVTFVPYLTGERSPVLSEGARGAFFGLDHATDRAAVLQAAVEGVSYAVRHALGALPGPAPAIVRLAGGGGLSPEFRSLLVDVLDLPLQPVTLRSASAVGSVLLAGRVAGLPGVASPVTYDEPILPSGSAAGYEEPYTRYRQRAAGLVDAAAEP
jgi:xylulokinase